MRSQQFGEVPEVPLDEGVWKPHHVDHRVVWVDGIRTVILRVLVHRLLVPAHARVVEPGIRTVILTVSRTHGRLMVGSKRRDCFAVGVHFAVELLFGVAEGGKRVGKGVGGGRPRSFHDGGEARA